MSKIDKMNDYEQVSIPTWTSIWGCVTQYRCSVCHEVGILSEHKYCPFCRAEIEWI